MCGIVGFLGRKNAAEVLLAGLSRLEYRGYDSAGIAVFGSLGEIEVIKTKGKLKNLEALLEKTSPQGTVGIGHTRWATHGEPSETNAHPHASPKRLVVGVHNGIIENFSELKAFLLQKGYVFSSETDTEIAVCLLDFYYRTEREPLTAMKLTASALVGSYALAVMFQDRPEEVYAMRKDSPLIVGTTDTETFFASDIPALLPYTRTVYLMENGEMAKFSKGSVEFFDAAGEGLIKMPTEIHWSAEAAEKEGYEHFMLKEIFEQPRVVRDTIRAMIPEVDFSHIRVGMTEAALASVTAIRIVACGSAYHAGLAASSVIESLSQVPVCVELASEFRYRNPIFGANDLVVVISQSGETADSLGALREAKRRGVRTLAIVNVVGSSIAREADGVIYTPAGPEIAVATTKAYSAQLIACDIFAIALGLSKGTLKREEACRLVEELSSLPEKIQEILRDVEHIKKYAELLAKKNDLFFIGRGQGYAICLEGSLKIKEISYIHAQAYPAGEMKHGTLSLIEKETPVIGVMTDEKLYHKMLGNMMEVKSRGAYLIALSYEPIAEADISVLIPQTNVYFAASLAAIPLQLLGYYASVARGHDVDKPRNLAKSVTVE